MIAKVISGIHMIMVRRKKLYEMTEYEKVYLL